jgi:catechol 2,3-dioxygenase-like lactoylglutathione lyase family enzyme
VSQSLAHTALIIRDYDEAIALFTQKLGFTLVADQHQPEQDKRWVLVAPPGASDNPATLLLPFPAFPTMLRIAGTLGGSARAEKIGADGLCGLPGELASEFQYIHFGYGRMRPRELGGVSCSSARRR